MSAWLITRNNSYFAVSNENGEFAIANLPTGVDLEFRVWQEKAQFVSKARINGQETKMSKGRLAITLDVADDTKNELDVVLDASVFR